MVFPAQSGVWICVKFESKITYKVDNEYVFLFLHGPDQTRVGLDFVCVCRQPFLHADDDDDDDDDNNDAKGLKWK